MALLSSAQSALDSHLWRRALAAFQVASVETHQPLAYEGWSQAAWWLDEGEVCLAARESAYRRHRELGDGLGAARAATALAWDTLLFGCGESVAWGWWGRAQSLLVGHEESAEHGWHAVREAELALETAHDPERAMLASERALALAQRLGLGDLEVVALAIQGLAMTNAGEVEAGLARLDSSVAAATAGDVLDPMWMGKVCCWLIAACNQSTDIGRAADWCRRVEAICAERDLAPLFNVCRIQYAAVHVAQGSWLDAEEQLTHVIDALAASRRTSRFEAVVQLGELRRRQGRLKEAKKLFGQAEFHPSSIAGRALIQIGEGSGAAAWAQMHGLLARLPRQGRLARASVLLAAVLAAHAADEESAAQGWADELRHIARVTGSESLMANSLVADAALARPEDATPLLLDAVRRFNLAGLCFDEAHTRLALVESLVKTGDQAEAQRHLVLAHEVLSDLHAAEDLARAQQLAQAIGAPNQGLLSARECEVLLLVAQGMSNQEVATVLVISQHTVHRHLANILTKLGQTSRTGAVSYAITAGLL